MAPCQFVRQCLTYLKRQVQFSHVQQIGTTKSFPVCCGQISRQPLEQLRSVFGSFIALLLEFNNIPTDLPIGLNQNRIHRLGCPLSASLEQFANLLN